ATSQCTDGITDVLKERAHCLSLRRFSPAAFHARYCSFNPCSNLAKTPLNIPVKWTDRLARLPLDVGSTECFPITPIPGVPLTQVKLRPFSNSDTFHSAGGSFGCRIHARLPICSGPLSRRRMLLTDAVHLCYRSTSLITAHTCSAEA